MSEPTTPEDRAAQARRPRARARRNAALGASFAMGVVLTLTLEDARTAGLPMMVSAATFLVGTIPRRSARGSAR